MIAASQPLEELSDFPAELGRFSPHLSFGPIPARVSGILGSVFGHDRAGVVSQSLATSAWRQGRVDA